jgi:hypothetical protein
MQRYKGAISRHRRPFWLPASNYYILSAAVTIGFFFLLWGILNDGREEAPWIPAGVGAAILLASAVIAREVILRQARNRFLASERRLDQSVRGIANRIHETAPPKLTLERNAALLHEIARKSEAAKILGRFAEGHREVFELCSEYLAAVTRELPNVGPGSPRIAALRRGTDVAERYHYFHMLQWAEIESRALTQQASKHDKISTKLESAQAALGVVEFALESYPQENALLDSHRLLVELVSSMRVSDLMERAERAAFKGNHKRALDLYQDALFFLNRNGQNAETEVLGHVNEEIGRIQQLLRDTDSGK